jgi:hypothetical protein
MGGGYDVIWLWPLGCDVFPCSCTLWCQLSHSANKLPALLHASRYSTGSVLHAATLPSSQSQPRPASLASLTLQQHHHLCTGHADDGDAVVLACHCLQGLRWEWGEGCQREQ